MSQFTETMYANARTQPQGHGHRRAGRAGAAYLGARCTSGPAGLRAAWPPPASGHGDAVAVLAGAPVEIAPTAQGIWMRGASLTMLHQPTPRTDLLRWAEETTAVINMIDAKAVVVSDPFMAAAPLLDRAGHAGADHRGPARQPLRSTRSTPTTTTSR